MEQIEISAMTAALVADRLARGPYANADELIAAAMLALADDRDPPALPDIRARIATALADPRPSLSLKDMLSALDAHHVRRSTAR